MRGTFAPVFKNILPLEGPWPLTSSRILDYLGGPSAVSGVKVNQETVLGIPAVYACVRVLSETVAALPLFVFERLEPRGRQRAPRHPAYRLLVEEPNTVMTSLQLREMMMGHLALRGNAFCEIDRDRNGQPVALWPLNPMKMGKPHYGGSGLLMYPYQTPDGQTVELSQLQVLHLRGLSDDGVWGYSPLALEREAFGHALATQEYANRFFGNSARPSGVLQAKGKLTKDGAMRMKESWVEANTGLSNAQRIAVLEEGVEWKALSVTPEEAQFLETRAFSVAEIARIFRVPPHMIGDVDRSTSWGTGIEQQTIGFVQYTLMPWLIRWEQQLHKDLFLPDERERFYPKFVLAGLLRGDMAARQAYYAAGRQWGWFSADDVREFEEMNPLPDGSGETYLEPINMRPAGTYEPPVAVGASS